MTINNEKPSIYSVLYWLVQDKKVDSQVFFNFLEFFWPTFMVYENYVFLSENFSEEKFNNLIKQNKEEVEFWMNLLLTDPYFEDDNWKERAKSLAQSLVAIWQLKLKNDFPDMKFIVKYIYDSENGDYGLTFYRDS